MLWDVATGRHVATFSGHEDVIYSLAFSNEGTLLASVGGCGGRPECLSAHTPSHLPPPPTSSSSQGSADCTVRIWDAVGPIKDPSKAASMETGGDARGDDDDRYFPPNLSTKVPPRTLLPPPPLPSDDRSWQLTCFNTKATPVFDLEFGRTNLLLASGVFQPEK